MKQLSTHVLSVRHILLALLCFFILILFVFFVYGKGSVFANSGDATTATSTITIVGGTTTISPPTSFTVIQPSCGTGKLYLSWHAATGAVSYTLYRNNSAIYQGGLTLEFADTGLALGTTYSYSIVTVGNGITSSPAFMTATSPPVCPANSSPSGTGSASSSPAVSNGYSTTNSTGTTAPNVPYTQSYYQGTYQSASSTHDGTVTTTHATSSAQGTTVPTNTTTYAQAYYQGTYQNTAPVTGTQVTTEIQRTTPPVITTPASTERDLVPVPTQPITTPVSDQVVVSFTSVVSAYDTTKNAVDTAKNQLVSIIDSAITDSFKGLEGDALTARTDELKKIRTQLIKKINATLDGVTNVTPTLVASLKSDISSGVERIRPQNGSGTGQPTVNDAIATLAGTVESSSAILRQQGGDLLYKDTNHDGISDYESKTVYNIDPVKANPTTEYNGKKITAGEKILLGFDPAQKGLVPVQPEDPTTSVAPVTPAYTVEGVSLTNEKKVSFVGSALPNSYVTLYIFSTPIVVTIKTDASGQWRYTLDKELDDGTHTITTATVNNSGKILAKSNGFAFTKTAEAATLASALPSSASYSAGPRVFELSNFNLLLGAFAGIFLFALFLIGLGVRNRGQSPGNWEAPPPPEEKK